MTYIQRLVEIRTTQSGRDIEPILCHPLILIVDDCDVMSTALRSICNFLDIAIERVPSEQDLARELRECRPMAIFARLDCQGQDGYHVMMTVAEHDRSLPILVISGDDPALAGAADAVEELWKLKTVVKYSKLPGIGAIVDFIFRASHKGRCLRLTSV